MSFHFPIYLQAYAGQNDDARDSLFRTRPGSVIIEENWKLHHYFEDNEIELYNLKEDIGERHNLINTHPNKASKLLEKLNKWRSEIKAPIPIELNPEYDPTFISSKKKKRN